MEHKLRIERKLRRQPKTAGVVHSIVGKFGTHSNQGPIYPSKDIRHFVRFSLRNGHPCRQDCRCFLVKGHFDGRVLHSIIGRNRTILGRCGRIVPRSAQGGGPQPRLAGRMLVLGQELNVPAFAFTERGIPWVGDIKVNGHGRVGIQSTQSPSTGSALADFQLRDIGPIFVE
eukprot:scaffold24748_cov152-Cylindrotheca_fusiformis.AAC.2